MTAARDQLIAVREMLGFPDPDPQAALRREQDRRIASLVSDGWLEDAPRQATSPAIAYDKFQPGVRVTSPRA
jgi:hypothetical protein